MYRKTLLSTGIALALSAGSAQAQLQNTETISIDFDGVGGSNSFTDVGSLDWAVGSSFSDDSVNIGEWDIGMVDASGNTVLVDAGTAIVYNFANPGTTATCVNNCTFDLYTHAALSGYADASGNPRTPDDLNSVNVNNPDRFEWTFILGTNEDLGTQSVSMTDTGTDYLDASGNTVGNILAAEVSFQFDQSSTNPDFFFEMYYDTAVNADALSGQGYDDGQLILDADELTFIDGDFSSTAFNFVDVNGDGAFSLLDASGNATGDFILTGTVAFDASGNAIPNQENSSWLDMDSFGNNNWNDGTASATNPECDTNANADTDGNCASVQGTGGTQLEATVDTYDTDFFAALDLNAIISDLVWSTQNVDPFLQTQPSGCYDTAAGSGSADDNCSFVFGSIVNPDGTISDSVVNGSSSTSNCAYAGTLAQIQACFQAVTAGEDVLFQTDANQGFRTTRQEVPEPGTLALLGMGGMGLGFLGLGRRRRKNRG